MKIDKYEKNTRSSENGFIFVLVFKRENIETTECINF